MIDINLLPPNLRKKKKSALVGGLNIPPEIVVGSAGAVFGLLIAAHLVLLYINSQKLSVHKQLTKEWEEIQPAKENVDKVIEKLRKYQKKLKDIQGITNEEQVIWSQKLNIISNNLPRGVWLTKVALTEDAFFIQGSAISREQVEMINVHSLAANLKRDKDFLNHLKGIDLGSIQRRKIANTEIADFVITMELE